MSVRTRTRRVACPTLLPGLAALLLATVVAACAPVGDRVVILGDSITALGETQIHRTLDDDYNVAVSGVFGDRTDQRIGAAQLQAGLRPRQAIVNLGTNDVLQHRPTDRIIENLRRIVDAYSGARCIHLVTVNPRLDQAGNRPWSAAAQLNERMQQMADQIPGASLIRWDRIVEDALPESLTTDGVHPSAEGQRLLADAYAEALASC